MFHIEVENSCSSIVKGQAVILTINIWHCKIVLGSNTGLLYTVAPVILGKIGPCLVYLSNNFDMTTCKVQDGMNDIKWMILFKSSELGIVASMEATMT